GVSMYLLQWERGMYGWLRQAALHARLADLVRSAGDLSDDVARQLGEGWVRVTALRGSTARTVQRLAAGDNPGPAISADKVLLSLTEQLVLDCERRLRP